MVQRFAQVFGVIYLLVGILGYISPLLAAKTPDSCFTGALLRLFYVTLCPRFYKQPQPR